MEPYTVTSGTWRMVLTCYFMIGLATQLPSGIYRRYHPMWRVRDNLERNGPIALLDFPFVWIPFVILLWPGPFMQDGIRLAPIVAAGLGLLAGWAITHWISSFWVAGVVVILTGIVACVLFKPREK